MTVYELLVQLAKGDASDLHLCAGAPPCFRLNGQLKPAAENARPLDFRELENMLFQLLTEEQRTRMKDQQELDFSVGLPEVGRFRANLHRQRGSWAAVFRRVPHKIPTLEELGLPEVVRTLARKESGLVLVTGPTGCGKSMTLAAMLECINTERACHIITIEDPVEFLFKNKKAIIKQREVGTDTENFATALNHVFRQDPDVLLIGELRDRDTLTRALSAATTGRLVMGTLATLDAVSTLDRLIESFPSDQQAYVRNQVSGVLEGIISQHLLVGAEGPKRYLATEIMVSTPPVRKAIRQGKTAHVLGEIEGGDPQGMHSLNQSLQTLVLQKKVKLEEALRHTRFPEDLQKKLGHPQ